MATETREALLVALPAAEAERALDEVLTERGFERAELSSPLERDEPVARSDERFFDVSPMSGTVSLVREWGGYSDVTPWGAALELAEGLPAAARMEMALPPALSVLARALSRRVTVLGFASREKPWHLVGVAFRGGRAVDVITAVKDRVVVGAQGQPQPATRQEAKLHLTQWLTPFAVEPAAIDVLLGASDLPAIWRVAYVHDQR